MPDVEDQYGQVEERERGEEKRKKSKKKKKKSKKHDKHDRNRPGRLDPIRHGSPSGGDPPSSPTNKLLRPMNDAAFQAARSYAEAEAIDHDDNARQAKGLPIQIFRAEGYEGGGKETLRQRAKRKVCTKDVKQLLYVVFALFAMCCFLALALWQIESTDEKVYIDAMAARHHMYRHRVMWEVFGFIEPLPERCSTCDECFPQAAEGATQQPGVPRISSEEMWTADYTECTERSDTCQKFCVLTLPTTAQVEKCYLGGLFDSVNPLAYDMACLVNSADCPNCDRISGSADGFSFSRPSPNDGSTNHQLVRADIYKYYMGEIEAEAANNWDPKGSFFFSVTIMSTIGYGTFAPKTDGGKILCALVALPAVAVFGFAISQIADFVLSFFVMLITGKPTNGENRVENAKKYAKMLLKYDRDGDGELGVDELISATRDLDDDLGKDGQRLTFVERKKEIDDLFATFNKDGGGSLAPVEAAQLFDIIVQRREAAAKQKDAKRYSYLILALAGFMLALGTIVFWAVEESWTFLDSFYFCVITLSTIGLGDYAPNLNSDGTFVFWVIYVVFGLGLVASLISSLTTLAASKLTLSELSNKKEDEDEEETTNNKVAPAPSP